MSEAEPKTDRQDSSETLASELPLFKATGDFAELVAAGTPTPGGGSVAAYAGVMAAALGRMMCNLTMGKPKFAEAEARVKEIRSELERLGARAGALIDEDAASFERVLAAYRLPKQTDEEKAARKQEIEAAGRGAAYTPYDTARNAFEILKLVNELKTIGNPNALPDATVAARLAELAVRGASYNIIANLSMFSDGEEADRLRGQITDFVESATRMAEEIESHTLDNL
ncbi:MAG: cyclodeaminase/cyclohydrolase family protein [Blastocatellia bacterium]|nr:cyclodeaminase/cyclohydrolase family protein [Blastocatellia bacterium]